jgi:arylsulfatase A-like enzyme
LIHLGVQRESTFELYNIAADPSELHDVSAMFPDLVNELRTIMEKERTADELWPLFRA